MNYTKICLLLMTMLSAQITWAVTMVDPGAAKDAVATEFGKTGKVDDVDPKGEWIRINNKKYMLNGTGLLKLEDLRTGLHINFNVEKEKNEKNGRVTRIWVDDHAK